MQVMLQTSGLRGVWAAMTAGVAFGAGDPTAWSTQVRDTERHGELRFGNPAETSRLCTQSSGSPPPASSALYIFGAERSLRTELCAPKFSLEALVGHPGPPNVAVFGDLSRGGGEDNRRSLGWTLIPQDRAPYEKRRSAHRHTRRGRPHGDSGSRRPSTRPGERLRGNQACPHLDRERPASRTGRRHAQVCY